MPPAMAALPGANTDTLVLLLGGGLVGLAVAHALRRLRPGCQVGFVGTPDRLEAQVVPEAGYPFFPIRAQGLSRHPIRAIKALWMLGVAVVLVVTQ